MTPETIAAAYLHETGGDAVAALHALAADALALERSLDVAARGVSAGMIRAKPLVPTPVIRERVVMEPL